MLLATTQLPALAGTNHTRAAIKVTAALASNSTPRYLWVIYRSKKYSKIYVKGYVTNASSGMAVDLYADEFPYTAGWQPIRQVVLHHSGTEHFRFTATPTLATRYRIELFLNTSSSTPLQVKKLKQVYVLANYHYYPVKKCGRPVCRLTVHAYVIVPPSTIRTEVAKRVYGYFNYTIKRNGTPRPPQWLYRGVGHLHVTKPHEVSTDRYDLAIGFWFKLGHDRDRWSLTYCSKDTESVDGLNLPGHHGCGRRRVFDGDEYLG
jgi:hypothetical protein